MRNISNYIWKIISVGLLLTVGVCSSFSKEKVRPEGMETFYGLSVGLDVLHPMLHLFNHDRMGVNADVQVDLWHKLYPTVVVGYDWFDASDEYSYPIEATDNLYKVNGFYFKVGAMYNIWKKNYTKAINPMAYFGINYAFSPHYQYTIENYPINNNYWSGEKGNVFSHSGNTTSHWGEILAGVKTPIAGRFCLGFEVMFKLFLHIKDQKFDNYTIHQSHTPGFGDQESGKWGFRYTISYFFHL